jgi:3-oxoacyl-[acyl-carrier-protein] synthase-3
MVPSSSASSGEQESWTRLVEECFRREAGGSAGIPGDTVDLIQSGILDSMAWVGFLRAVETASGISELGIKLNERPASLASVISALRDSRRRGPNPDAVSAQNVQLGHNPLVLIQGFSSVLGSRIVRSEEIDQTFGMPVGKLRHRAGFESLAYASEGEDELSLGTRAAEEALQAASCGARELDWIIATSETHHSYPSLAAQLHSRLLTRENCGALDVGGACLGLLNALAVARSLIGSRAAQTVLIVTADVHSRTLRPGRVAGEFGGLFGDGAAAFLLRGSHGTNSGSGYRLGELLFGCAGEYAAAIRVSDDQEGGLAVQFDGDALSRAAITRMEKIITTVELRSGIPRASVGGFATHQPNPRLLTLLAKQCGVLPEVFPPVCRTSGNLGSTMCAAALHAALQAALRQPAAERKPIFLAALGPGLLFAGGWLTPGS